MTPMSRVAFCRLNTMAVGAPNFALGNLLNDGFDGQIASHFTNVEEFWSALFYVVKLKDSLVLLAAVYAYM